jgi:transposase-like protein
MVSVSSPICPSCGAWNDRVVYKATGIGAAQDKLAGKCHDCKHEWTD